MLTPDGRLTLSVPNATGVAPLVPAAERLLPHVGGARFAYHVLLRCRPAGQRSPA